MKKTLFATAALAVMIASPALAQSGFYAPAAPHGAWQAAPFGAYAQTRPNAFVPAYSQQRSLGGDYVGTDPDPNVRLELLKDAQSRE